MIGKTFGKLTVLSQASSAKRKRRFRCRCKCGAIKVCVGTRLRTGATTSCGKPGCKPGTSHGLSKKSRAYVRWKTMVARCLNPKHERYKDYGGRGIKLCKRWLLFPAFLADMGEPPKGTVLDRKNGRGHYWPSNCRWVSFQKSTENRSNTVWIGGQRVDEIARIQGIPASRIYSRRRAGWSPAEIALGRRFK